MDPGGPYRSGAVVAAGAIVTVAAALVLAGGAQRIARAAEAVVPFMAVGYVVITGLLLVRNAAAIPAALGELYAERSALRRSPAALSDP